LQFARVNGVTIHHQVIGAVDKPLIVFSNSVGTDYRIWRDVVVRLAGSFAIVCYDQRGAGLSGIGRTPYTINVHAEDLIGLLDHLRLGPAIICGLSIGGLIAQGLWSQRPDLVDGLVLCDTAHKIGAREMWDKRISDVRAGGITSISEQVMGRWFTDEFRKTPEGEGYRAMLERQPAEGYLASLAALRDADFTDVAQRIDVPTLVCVGDRDLATPPSLCAEFARLIPGARFEVVKNAGHILPVEQPEVLSEMIRAFAPLTREGVMANVATRH
jgi:3-oxoadipate enol-lactonase